MNQYSRKEYLFQRVKLVPKRRTRVGGSPKKNRKHSRVYSLKTSTREQVPVCAKFFLTALGFKQDNTIAILFKDECLDKPLSITSISDERGKHDPHHKMSELKKTKIIQHIESYHPTESHYQRAHVPLRKYLPSELTIAVMHKHFLKIHRQKKVSYESYRKSLKSTNISFTKLGEENVGFVKNTHIIDVKERKILMKRKMKRQL